MSEETRYRLLLSESGDWYAVPIDIDPRSFRKLELAIGDGEATPEQEKLWERVKDGTNITFVDPRSDR